jgi:lipid II:glycine glycyltransferase (peptidoglycan interpeptide bridge formation enzyme)
VSAFKESLGGMKIEWYGNYDLVLNPILYKLFKIYTKIRDK